LLQLLLLVVVGVGGIEVVSGVEVMVCGVALG